jgi:hypothetical protein
MTSPRPVRRIFVVGLGLFLATVVGAQAQQHNAQQLNTQQLNTQPASPAKPPATKGRPSTPTKMVLESRAMDMLKATSAVLAAAKSMSFTAVASYEFPSQLGPPLIYTVRYDVTMQRPDKLRVIIPGDGPASEFYYDGKSMMAYAPAENLVAVADAPPTIEGALKAAFDNADIYYPFTDLVVADPYDALTNGAILAFYIGSSEMVGGTRTEMLAWANPDVFLQIWIGVDDKLPRRVRAVYSADPLGLRHQLDLSDWKLDAETPAGSFTSEKAKSAQPMKFDRPVNASTPPGLRPLVNEKPSKAAPQPAAKSP